METLPQKGTPNPCAVNNEAPSKKNPGSAVPGSDLSPAGVNA